VISLVYDTEEDILYVSHYTSSKITMVDGGTGILEYSSAVPERNSLSMSPNPAKDRVNIKYMIRDAGYTINELHVRIYDITGRLVSEKTLEYGQGEYSISLEGVNPGVYFVVLEDGTDRITGKLVLLD